MNEAFNWGILIATVGSLVLGAILAIRLKQRFGFMSPAGFIAAVLIHLVCRAAMLPLTQDARIDAAKVRTIIENMPMEDKLYYMSLQGHATGIWTLGVICFLICGLLDIRAPAETVTPVRARIAWIIAGTLIMAASAFYPHAVVARLVR